MPSSKDLNPDVLSCQTNHLDSSVMLTERYFHLVYQKYGVSIPEDASWKRAWKPVSLEKLSPCWQKVPNMLFEIADLFEDA